MKNVFLCLYLVTASFFSFTNAAYAHSGLNQTVDNYTITFSQQPLSPFVGEEVTITMTIEDKLGRAISNLQGYIIVKQYEVEKFVGKDAEQEIKELSRNTAKTDASGVVSTEYTFKNQGFYDVEFVWGEDEETESTGLTLQVREPTSFFLPQELLKRIWFFVGIAFLGFVIGGIATFILLIVTLHPKK